MPCGHLPENSLHKGSSSNKLLGGSCWEPGWVLDVPYLRNINVSLLWLSACASGTDASYAHPHPSVHAAPLPASGSLCLRGFSGPQGPPAHGWDTLEVSGNECSLSSPQPVTERGGVSIPQLPHPAARRLKCALLRDLPGDGMPIAHSRN